VGAALGWGIKMWIGAHHPITVGGLVLVPYGLTYFAVTWMMGVEECEGAFRRVLRLRR
jgi:hypothetical protein